MHMFEASYAGPGLVKMNMLLKFLETDEHIFLNMFILILLLKSKKDQAF